MLLVSYFLATFAIGNASSVPESHSRRLAPILAPSWQAKVVVHGGGYIFHNTSGKFYSDSIRQYFRMSIRTHTDMFSKAEVQSLDMLSRNVPVDFFLYTYGVGPAAQCHPSSPPGKTFDTSGGNPFWWVPFATYKATIPWGDETCEQWVFATFYGQASICVAKDGTPRYVAHSPLITHLSYVSSFLGGFLVFSDVVAGPLPGNAFDVSRQCGKDAFPPPVCKSKGKTVLDVYRVQGRNEPYNLINKNVGDALGSAFFACAGTSGFGDGKHLAHYKVTADSSWLPFSNCGYDSTSDANICSGPPGRQVGRCTPEVLGGDAGHEGQCDDNDVMGSWYSFPKEGHCEGAQEVGDGGCTWKAELQNVVELSCVLRDHGMRKTCGEEKGKPPFSRSESILKAALESENAAKGGCPAQQVARKLWV